jgi:hypothetical protein
MASPFITHPHWRHSNLLNVGLRKLSPTYIELFCVIVLIIDSLQLLRFLVLVTLAVGAAVGHLEFYSVLRLDDAWGVGVQLDFAAGFGR